MTEANPVEGQYAVAPGGHLLPHRFSAGPASVAPPRKKHTGVLLGVLGAAAAVMVIGALQLTANLGYDGAEEAFIDTAATAQDAQATVQTENDELRAASDAATLILGSDTGALIDPASTEAFATAGATASSAIEAADLTLAETIPSSGDKPTWFWELFGETGALNEHRAEVEELTAELRDDSADIAAADTALTDSGVAALTAAAATASTLEAAHVSARNDSVIALRNAVDDTAATVALDTEAVDAFSSLQAASAQLIESENAELAEKAGPLLDARLEVEAFARSIAPGVLLEFDWAPLVNGFGYDGGMGGYTTWWWDEPGRAIIQLSNSVAEQWPDARSQALVVHEVGHAISVKCADMYDASTQDSIEKWATAWAISMGYTDDANGVWAYGYPPQSYIDAAAGCR